MKIYFSLGHLCAYDMEPGVVFGFALLFIMLFLVAVLYAVVYIDYHPHWRKHVFATAENFLTTMMSTTEEQDESDFTMEDDKKNE